MKGLFLIALFLGLAATGGCSQDPVQNTYVPDMDSAPIADEDPKNLDPQSIFEARALPVLGVECQACHAGTKDFPTFLTRGDEYNSIVKYDGGKFVVAPEGSLLLHKPSPPHIGPNLKPEEYDRVAAWLSVEVAVRGTAMKQSPATPTVPLRSGEFFISLEKLTADPLARVTFRGDLKAGNQFRITDLKVTAGPTAALKITHPKFIIITARGVSYDQQDQLRDPKDADLVLNPGETKVLGPGALYLTDAPSYARVGLAFVAISAVNQKPLAMFPCKGMDLFSSTVLPTLQAPCALVCHGNQATNQIQSRSAAEAFGMTPGDSAEAMQLLCMRALARVDQAMPMQSILVQQVTPEAAGGTPNHPYKLTSGYADFAKAVSAWAAASK